MYNHLPYDTLPIETNSGNNKTEGRTQTKEDKDKELNTKRHKENKENSDYFKITNINSGGKIVFDKKQHKRTNTQYSFINQHSKVDREKSSSRKMYTNKTTKIENTSNSNISCSNTFPSSEGESLPSEGSKKSNEADKMTNFLVNNTDELKKENTFRREAKKTEAEEKKREGARASNQSNGSGKHMYLFYRTPSNKENKKLDFSIESDNTSS